MRRFLVLAAALTAAALVQTGAASAQTGPGVALPREPAGQFFDPSSKTWVTYYMTPEEQQRRRAALLARQVVPYETDQPAGTVIVDTYTKYLYFIQADGKAMRYGIGVGKEGFEWSGIERISRKAEWPSWTPPAEMRARRPGLPSFMPGGPKNPLGARALYLGSTLYRIHGTNEEWSIGYAVSSGCIRMMNADVIDLYSRVGVGTKVVIIGPGSPFPSTDPFVTAEMRRKLELPAPALVPKTAS